MYVRVICRIMIELKVFVVNKCNKRLFDIERIK